MSFMRVLSNYFFEVWIEMSCESNSIYFVKVMVTTKYKIFGYLGQKSGEI